MRGRLRAHRTAWALAFAGAAGAGASGYVRPADPEFPWQWALENRGQPVRMGSEQGGTPDADVDGVEAFAAGYRGAGVIIALVGQGFRYRGSDLEPVLWRNPGEVASNDRDDDGNGLIDDVVGYDFGDHDPDPSFASVHDQRVAEIAVAPHDARSVAGIAPDARLMVLKVTDGAGNLIRPALFRALGYAVDHGARVLILPWTIREAGCSDPYLLPLADVFDAAARRALIVGGHPADWPACLDSVVSVQPTDADDRPKEGRHATLDFAAPGSDGRTPVAVSYALGLVGGAAALLFSQNPDRTPEQVRNLLARTADRVHPEVAGYRDGWSDLLGAGRINVARALGTDFDGDGIIDPDDPDSDGDGRPEPADPCPLDPSPTCGEAAGR